MKAYIQVSFALFLLSVSVLGQQPPAARLSSGSYKVDTWVNGALYSGTLRLSVTGSQLSGESEWSCCPGRRVDALSGEISGNTVRWRRNCSGQGNSGPCDQVYEGVSRGNVIEGFFTHNGARAGTWKMVLPLEEKPPEPAPISTLTSGTYKVETRIGSALHLGSLRLTVTGGRLSGESEWNCCPGRRIDALAGEITGATVRWRRDCSGQGNAGPCQQVYEGTIKGGNLVDGFITHNGARAGTWKMTPEGNVSEPPPQPPGEEANVFLGDWLGAAHCADPPGQMRTLNFIIWREGDQILWTDWSVPTISPARFSDEGDRYKLITPGKDTSGRPFHHTWYIVKGQTKPPVMEGEAVFPDLPNCRKVRYVGMTHWVGCATGGARPNRVPRIE